MIAISTHSIGSLPRALIGSVADRVIRTFLCTVLLVL
ncbi:MAG: universal stress protein [Methanosarcinales archaeon]|nr:universal stress protein [Methanosarcinales archaeon]